ncbi:hypothetical protein [Prochlorococcus marinus]|nr:hypothetical protein [Prochlorococcus marinus]
MPTSLAPDNRRSADRFHKTIGFVAVVLLIASMTKRLVFSSCIDSYKQK